MPGLDIERFVGATPGTRTRAQLDGTWRNTLGSELTLHVTDEHALLGSFRPKSPGSFPGAHPVHGFAEGRSFSFCVDFGEHGSVASWTGHHIDDEAGERLETLWLLARSRDDHSRSSGSPAWGALLTGSNTFVRQS